ncbi:hypothetical protein ACRRTK_023849 [Alexandromys fortis]
MSHSMVIYQGEHTLSEAYHSPLMGAVFCECRYLTLSSTECLLSSFGRQNHSEISTPE